MPHTEKGYMVLSASMDELVTNTQESKQVKNKATIINFRGLSKEKSLTRNAIIA